MLSYINDPLARFRAIALLEGLSFLFLLFVSMPLKYMMGITEFSFFIGMTHGVLFVIYIVLALEIVIRRHITALQFIRVFIASIIPFGTFFNEGMLKKQQEKFA